MHLLLFKCSVPANSYLWNLCDICCLQEGVDDRTHVLREAISFVQQGLPGLCTLIPEIRVQGQTGGARGTAWSRIAELFLALLNLMLDPAACHLSLDLQVATLSLALALQEDVGPAAVRTSVHQGNAHLFVCHLQGKLQNADCRGILGCCGLLLRLWLAAGSFGVHAGCLPGQHVG